MKFFCDIIPDAENHDWYTFSGIFGCLIDAVEYFKKVHGENSIFSVYSEDGRYVRNFGCEEAG